MDKATIEFLRSAGYTLQEIMSMDAATQAPAQEPQQIPIPDPKPAASDAPAQDPLEEKLTALRNEIAQLRGSMQAQNRQQTVIEPVPKQTSFTEDIEQMIKEVTT